MTPEMNIEEKTTLAAEKITSYDTAVSPRTVDEARQEGEQTLLRELQTLMAEDGTVESTRFAAAEQDGYLTVTLKAECLEQIGRSVPIGS